MEAACLQRPLRIVLIGFMGAGKSTVGTILAERLDWRFLDADHEIQERTGATIAETFINLGESVFRALEAEVVSEMMTHPQTVFALGGGAIEMEATRSLIYGSSDIYTVFLQAPLEVMVGRCERQEGAAVRPVLQRRDALRDRLDCRLPYYQKAHLCVNTEGRSPTEVVDHILQRMLESPCDFPQIQKAIGS